ncbi:MAG TPA: serine/threonine-protein kinase [Kofleriaceae bacterium]
MIAPGLRFGKYELRDRVGKGGFGVVHVAHDRGLDRDVAIKLLKPEYLMRPQMVQRFLQEARAAAKIGHAGIVTVFECGIVEGSGTRTDGTAYIAMELLRGESLAERGRLPVDTVIEIGRQLAAALGAAHDAGIIHRDLKPDNVFLVPDAAVHGGTRVKLLDFGVAKLTEEDGGVHTHSAVLLGTPRYMSPEQCRSSTHVDHRSDIYMLGCILYELLSGHTPFAGDLAALIELHQHAPPPHLDAGIPAQLDELIARMLAKDPADRPASMAAVAASLAAIAGLAEAPTTLVPRVAPESIADARGPMPDDGTTVSHVPIPRRRWLAIIGVAALTALAVTAGVLAAMHTSDAAKPAEAAPSAQTAAATTGAVVETPPAPVAPPTTTVATPPVVETPSAPASTPAPVATPAMAVDAAPPPAPVAVALPPEVATVAPPSTQTMPHAAPAHRPAPTRAPPPPPPPPAVVAPQACETPDEATKHAEAQYSAGFAGQALTTLEKGLACSSDGRLVRMAALYSCRAKNPRKAMQYYARLETRFQAQIHQACMQEGIALP